MQRSVLFVTVGLMLAGGAAAAPKVKHRHTPTAAHVNKTLLKQRSAAPSVTADAEPFAALERVTVDADSMDMDKNGDHFVNGYVINKNAQAILFVEIVVNFFDDAGVLVDSGTADTQDLASGGVWSFQVTSPCEGITTYKIVKVIHQYRRSMHG